VGKLTTYCNFIIRYMITKFSVNCGSYSILIHPTGLHFLPCTATLSPTQGTYQCNDGEWRPLEVYLRETHEAWLPFGSEEDCSNERVRGSDIRFMWVLRFFLSATVMVWK